MRFAVAAIVCDVEGTTSSIAFVKGRAIPLRGGTVGDIRSRESR